MVDKVFFCKYTTSERTSSNARYAIGDGDRGEGGAAGESLISNACNAIGDGDGGERTAMIESHISNTRNAVRDSDGGERRATIESTTSNARNAVGGAIVGNGFMDSGGSECHPVIIRIRGCFTCHLYGIRCRTAGDIVVEVT